ncbi:MAG: DEAD/DEAH box helicase [Verrucomicrobia bacterium]|nr:DEAD/DEAH box helicase [Verrucomicrobiota bacterium]
MLRTTTSRKDTTIAVPPSHDWRTTDEDEINKRRLRARTESFTIANTDASHPIFSNFRVKSGSGMTYSVEIRDLVQRHVACNCTDFRSNGLGTCKHVEAVLLLLEARHKRLYRDAKEKGSDRIDIVPDQVAGVLRIERGRDRLPPALRKLFSGENGSSPSEPPEAVIQALARAAVSGLRISQEVAPWAQALQHAEERKRLRREYENKVQAGEWPVQETKVPLYPYQREGMLHLAFIERALLADEMGLGKTIQAIAACALLHRLGKASRVLVVTPASLKTEWEEQIQRFTSLPYQLVFGLRHRRLQLYEQAPFFTIVNYEQMVKDSLDVNERLKPDAVILDEAQRIKNWSTKTAQAIKRLNSRYAFVLTGTPIENRIDELHSLMDFLDSSVLGPLFRFNREFYTLDDRGRPAEYRNLDRLHARIKPYMLRRRKDDVETELPDRTDKTFFVPLSGEQQNAYDDHEAKVARLISIAKRRPLTQQEQEKLMRELAMMRMVCDTNFILDPEDRVCPKLAELEKILEECRENAEVKLLIFSEWERMLLLVRELCERMGMGHAWHTGSVPQRRRRAEILLFKNDPNCRVFLSTDSGSTGLNLQSASVVINCDLPWNPAKLEQRIARAWRKHQTRSVTVIHLVSENTIEHRMLGTLGSKQALADGVLDLRGDLKEIKLSSGRAAFLNKLQQIMAHPAPGTVEEKAAPKILPTDRALAFAQRARQTINGAMVRCEERYPSEGAHSVLMVVVDRDAPVWMQKLIPLHQGLFGAGQSDPLAPVMLEVIDRATDEALQRLQKAGLVTVTARATRPLYPEVEAAAGPQPLSAEEKQKADAHRGHAARKLKMARLLGQGELVEEARESLQDTIFSLSRALAVEKRMREPADLKDALLPPGAFWWGESLPAVRDFIVNPEACWRKTAETLEKVLTAGAGGG